MSIKLAKEIDIDKESWKQGFRHALFGQPNQQQYAVDSIAYAQGYEACLIRNDASFASL